MKQDQSSRDVNKIEQTWRIIQNVCSTHTTLIFDYVSRTKQMNTEKAGDESIQQRQELSVLLTKRWVGRPLLLEWYENKKKKTNAADEKTASTHTRFNFFLYFFFHWMRTQDFLWNTFFMNVLFIFVCDNELISLYLII